MASKAEKLELAREVTFADVVILAQLVELESALMKASANQYLYVDVKPLLKNVQHQIGILTPRIRVKMNKA